MKVILSRSKVKALEFPTEAVITDVEHLSSYNWIEATSPTIAVPGSPAVWAPPNHSSRLNQDAGRYCVDQNASRLPNRPLEPLFAALFKTQPSFDILSTDVVSDRYYLRRLLSIIDPSANGNGKGDELKSFKIDIEIHKNTALFHRVDPPKDEIIPPGKFRGFGREFEKAYTRHRIKGSGAHYRIISYNFGGLKFVVRHETDGYVKNSVDSSSSGTGKTQPNGLSKTPNKLILKRNQTSTAPYRTSSGLIVRPTPAGRGVPLDCTLEIKTRTIRKRLNISDVAAQIWISQTPKLVRAYYFRDSTFTDPKVEDVKSEIEKWQADNQPRLRKLAALIREILDVVKRNGNRAILRYVADCKKLIISPHKGEKMLPEEIYRKWELNHALSGTVQETPAATNPAGLSLHSDQGKPGRTIRVGGMKYEGIDPKVRPHFARAPLYSEVVKGFQGS